jgi:hypothetical protein
MNPRAKAEAPPGERVTSSTFAVHDRTPWASEPETRGTRQHGTSYRRRSPAREALGDRAYLHLRHREEKVRRKEKKNVAHGHAHIKSTFNNTIVSITDPHGQRDRLGLGRHVGFKGSRKSTPFAAQMAAEAPRARPWSTACARSTCSSRARVRAARPRSARCRPPASRSARSRRHPGAPQRLPSAQAPPGLSRRERLSNHGSLHRTRLQARRREKTKLDLKGAKCDSARSRSVRTRRASTAAVAPRTASTCCRCARSRRRAHLRRAGEAVPPLLRGGQRRPARPVRTCCASSRAAWTTSSTAPASPARAATWPASWSAHGHFTVNGHKVDIPSYRVSSSTTSSRSSPESRADAVRHRPPRPASAPVPAWLEVIPSRCACSCTQLPERGRSTRRPGAADRRALLEVTPRVTRPKPRAAGYAPRPPGVK